MHSCSSVVTCFSCNRLDLVLIGLLACFFLPIKDLLSQPSFEELCKPAEAPSSQAIVD